MMSLRRSQDWDRIKSLGLYNIVKTPYQYERLVSGGFAVAEDYLKSSAKLFPGLRDIQIVHGLAFKDVHPWAGSFRSYGQEVSVGNVDCALSSEVVPRLKDLTKQLREVCNPETSTAKQTFWCAFYHIGLELIHPFQDGNGRVGRLILSQQLQDVLKDNKRSILDRREYIEALIEGRKNQNPSRLAELLITNRHSVKELARRRSNDLVFA